MTSTQEAIQNLLSIHDKLSNIRIVSFDIITDENNKIIEIGAIEMIDNQFTGLQFYSKIDKENKRFKLKNFHNFAYHSLLINQNIELNFKILKNELKSVGLKSKFKTFCLMVIIFLILIFLENY